MRLSSPEARTVTLRLVKEIALSVADIRRQLFENEQPPFKSRSAAAAWIEEQAAANAASQNSEIVRAIRERMQRESIETIRAEANAIQAHADALEAEGMGE